MATFNPHRHPETKGLVFCTRNARIVDAEILWPNNPHAVGVKVLIAETFIHDEWCDEPIRTSKIMKIVGADVYTLNSIYRVIDGSLLEAVA